MCESHANPSVPGKGRTRSSRNGLDEAVIDHGRGPRRGGVSARGCSRAGTILAILNPEMYSIGDTSEGTDIREASFLLPRRHPIHRVVEASPTDPSELGSA